MVYAVVELPNRRISFCRAGHNFPLLISGTGAARYLGGGGPPLGLGIACGGRKRQIVDMSPGDSFILFSDGINETVASRGSPEYGLARVKKVLRRHRDIPLGDSFDALIGDVQKFQGRSSFKDDISIIGFRWTGE
jgi:sigma-B regulation protein RsbU (phosphoserine phosphatase)